MNEDIRRELIMEHYQNPLNRRRSDDNNYVKVNTNNSSCIDNIDVYVKVNNNIIEDITFEGEACAISISSTSIMIENLIGKTIQDAKIFIKNFENMIDEKEYDDTILKSACAYNEIYKQNNRKNCAFLPYRAIKEVLDKYSN